ncbi:MAG: winged helix-turn-helix transcriptional regulator [Saprospiraceae bacterium]|nr:winged helix-turn-helix transcriptional regulator [Saprospiraceae bacterium]
MGLSKSNLFTEDQNKLAEMAKALGHPARIAILQYLISKGSCVCGDIVEELPLSQSTISQHLKALKQAGIIMGSVDGSYRCYCINASMCQSIKLYFNKLFDAMKHCC